MLPFNKTPNGFVTVVDLKPKTINHTHENYAQLYQAVLDGDAEAFKKYEKPGGSIANVVKNVVKQVEAGVSVSDVSVTFNGKPVHSTLVNRILEFKKNNVKYDFLVAFLTNLMQNPSHKSVEELYEFLGHNGLPITEDGCFLAYKAVQGDFYSKASGDLTLVKGKANSRGQIFNGVGEEIECLRNEVDDDRNNHCSKGLHVGAIEYSGANGWYRSSGDKVVIVKVNPKDAVSVPPDHNAQKLRTCAYTVVGEMDMELTAGPVYRSDAKTLSAEEAEAAEFDWDNDTWEDEDEVDVITHTSILPHAIKVDDYIEFFYNDEARTLKVTAVAADRVHGNLCTNEWDEWGSVEETSNHRTFIKNKMTDIEKLS